MNKHMSAHIATINSHVENIQMMIKAYKLEQKPNDYIYEIEKSADVIKQRIDLMKEEGVKKSAKDRKGKSVEVKCTKAATCMNSRLCQHWPPHEKHNGCGDGPCRFAEGKVNCL